MSGHSLPRDPEFWYLDMTHEWGHSPTPPPPPGAARIPENIEKWSPIRLATVLYQPNPQKRKTEKL